MNSLFHSNVINFIFKNPNNEKHFKRAIILTIISLLMITFLNAEIHVPYSKSLIKEDFNHMDDFVCVFPDDSSSAPLATDAWLWHDGKNLFIEWKAEIDDKFYKGKFAQKDQFVNADYLVFQLITDVNNYYSYMFFAFPRGSKMDAIRKSDLDYDTEWNSTYDYRNIISDDLWECTMKIPFDNLRFFGNPPYRWKIILNRWFLHYNETYAVPYVTFNMNKDYFRNAEDIIIKKEISNSNNYRFKPYFTLEYDLKTKTGEFDLDNFGMDFSFDPSFSSKFKLSINPDFLDVPLDSEEDIYNLRYAPTFKENRYFFIEDLDVFGVGGYSSETIFYSRHIMQPKYALKLTKSAEKYSYGFLSAQDKKVVSNGKVTNPDDFYNLAAYKHKSDRFEMQFTFLNRMNTNYHNEVLHLEPNWEFFDNHSIWSTVNLSYRDSLSKNSSGYYALIGYKGNKGDLGWSGNLTRISNNYTPDMGWNRETNVYQMNLNLWQNVEPNKKLIKDYGWYLWWYRESRNVQNQMLDNYAGANLWLSTQPKIDFWTSLKAGEEGYADNVYDWYRFSAGIEFYRLDWLYIEISYGRWNTLVYNLKDVYTSDGLDVDIKLDINRYSSLNFEISDRLFHDFPDTTKLDDKYLICNAKLELNLFNKISLTTGLRYNNYEYEDQKKHVGVFSNFRWQFRPECNIYLGHKLSTDELNNRFVADYEIVYLKLNYLF